MSRLEYRLKKIVDYIRQSRSESFCAKPTDEAKFHIRKSTKV
jgi:hypothetical protein